MDDPSQQNPELDFAQVRRVEINTTWIGGAGEFVSATVRQPVSLDFPPPPRIARRVYGRLDVTMQRLILAILLAAAIFFGRYLCEFAMVHLLGQTISARVTHLEKRPVKKEFDYWVGYTFEMDGQTHGGQNQVSADSWQKLTLGGGVPVKTVKFGNARWSDLSISAWDSTHPQYVFPPIFVSLVIFGLAYAGVFRPVRYARLLRYGDVTIGTAIKVDKSSRNNEQSVTYVYQSPGGENHHGQTSGRKSLWPMAGNQVAVFYDPRRCERSVAYGCCCFEIVR